jgi:GNAT superfamily N-acetyltransferase
VAGIRDGGPDVIRQAVETDIPALVSMGQRFHALSPVKDIAPYSAEAFEATLRAAIASDVAVVFVTEALDGMLGLICAPVYFSTVTFAQELFWWSEGKAGLRLLDAAEAWAREQGAAAFLMLRVDGLTERLDGLYQRRGFAPVEHTYAKGL